MVRSLMRSRLLILSAAAAVCTALTVPAGAQFPAPPPSASLAPYVPTPQDVVDRMLALASVTASDVVYDLGCGDGRIVVTAAKSLAPVASAWTSTPIASRSRRPTPRPPESNIW